MPERSFDVAIVGGGIMGSALAMELASAGRSVLLLEAAGIAADSTSRSAGGVRHQFTNDLNISLAKRTIAQVEAFPEEFGVECSFRQVGYLFLVSSEATRAAMLPAVERQRELGCETQFLTPTEVAEMVPGVRTDDLLGASFNPKDGFLDPATVASAFASRARAHGAVVRIGTAVTAIGTSGGRAVSLAVADGTRYGADVVVNAAGAWAPAVARLYGGDLPIEPWRSQIFTVQDVPEASLRYPMVIDFDGGKAYLHPEGQGLLIGMDNEDAAPVEWDPQPNWSKLPQVVETLVPRVPGLENASAVRAWAGFLEITPDEDPVVGWTHLDNVYTSAGFSGHGLSIAPALAAEVAREVQGLATTVDLGPYRLERFGRPNLRPEALAMR